MNRGHNYNASAVKEVVKDVLKFNPIINIIKTF